MSNASHTPGPWEADISKERHIFPSVFLGPELRFSDDSGSYRGSIVINEGPTPQNVKAGKGFGTTMKTACANARLIAASPDLLAACQSLIDCDNLDAEDEGWMDAIHKAIEQARLALHKATNPHS